MWIKLCASNFRAIENIESELHMLNSKIKRYLCDPYKISLGSLEIVSPQDRYDIVQTIIPSICSPFFSL